MATVVDAAVRLQLTDFSLDAEIEALRAGSGRMGGIAAFLGCARDFSMPEGAAQPCAVETIAFDAYRPMALAEMRRLREEAIARFGLIDARLVHRLGSVRAGDNIVLIATGAEHRAPALEACRWLIDALKERVPIWKKEIGRAGETWVTPHP